MPAVLIDGQTVSFKMEGQKILVDGREVNYEVIREEEDRLLVKIGDSVEEIIYSEKGEEIELLLSNETVRMEVLSDRDILLKRLESGGPAGHAHSEIKAPMPGLVVKILVADGERVKKGAKLIILEAMKMENEIRAAADSEVAEVLVHEGEIVDKDQTIMKLR